MTDTTKKEALVKLHAISDKIGYPERWRDYSALTITRGDALGNSQRSNAFEFHRQLGKIGKPVDKTRMGDDAADRQRVLQPAREQHQLPGRHPAAALLQRQAPTRR